MDALTGIGTLIVVGLAALVLNRRPRAYVPDDLAYAKAHSEPCAACFVPIYIWQGRFEHDGKADHRPLPMWVVEEMRAGLKEDEAATKPPAPFDSSKDTVVMIGNCPGCFQRHEIKADRAKYEDYLAGTPLEEAFPGLSRWQVAMFEHGWHRRCYEEWWPETEEEVMA